jgi:hypothetical protein
MSQPTRQPATPVKPPPAGWHVALAVALLVVALAPFFIIAWRFALGWCP